MGFTALDYQARAAALGIDPGPIDGLWGPKTQEAIKKVIRLKRVDRAEDIFHRSGLHRIIMHWTAGAYGDIALERRAYHILIAADGRAVMGDLAPEANSDCGDGRYAAHTRGLNTGSIGVSLDAMGDAQERPFYAGSYPITGAQVTALAETVADLALTYDIPVSRYTVLTHAEVQPTLGVWQRNKWDITWLPGMDRPGDPIAVGDVLRDRVSLAMAA